MRAERRHGGFTLVEVVVALVVLEICVIGVASMLTLASRTLTRAERLEAAVATAEGVLDSLRTTPAPVDGWRRLDGGGSIVWVVASGGAIAVRAESDEGRSLVELAGRRLVR